MNLSLNNSKIILIGIILIILNTFSGSSFDTITKFLSSASLMWYHYFALGNSFALLLLLIYLFFTSGIKKNIILKNKQSYFIPIIRGLIFIPIPITVYYALSYIPLNIFTTILMTTPFFVYVFSSLLLREKITLKFWLIIVVGFLGTILVIKPNVSEANLVVFLVFLVALHNAFTNVVVSKYANIKEGTIVMHDAIINAGAKLGKCNIINSKSWSEKDGYSWGQTPKVYSSIIREI